MFFLFYEIQTRMALFDYYVCNTTMMIHSFYPSFEISILLTTMMIMMMMMMMMTIISNVHHFLCHGSFSRLGQQQLNATVRAMRITAGKAVCRPNRRHIIFIRITKRAINFETCAQIQKVGTARAFQSRCVVSPTTENNESVLDERGLSKVYHLPNTQLEDEKDCP